MEIMYYIGLDIHKKTIRFCVKLADGAVVREGALAANRAALDAWMSTLPRPWMAAMEATLFTSWVYEQLKHCGAANFADRLQAGTLEPSFFPELIYSRFHVG